jgi:transposase
LQVTVLLLALPPAATLHLSAFMSVSPRASAKSGVARTANSTSASFRPFDNRRQVAAYAGLAPTPWKSGSIDHEQGVSKAGNPRLRPTMVELAWLWLQNQPTSSLSLWFHERVRRLGGRMRKTTIVALARKLLIALWRYTTAGVVIEGAVMKAAPATI